MLNLKAQSRVLGIDDGPYVRGSEETPVVMTVWRLDGYIDGFLMVKVGTDGDDSAISISAALRSSRFIDQIRCIISDGACLAGFNALHMDLLRKETGIPVITVSDETPDSDSISSALRAANIDNGDRLQTILAHLPFTIMTRDGPVHVRACGLSEEDAAIVVRRTMIRGRVPEPVRISHMIAKAIYPGGVDRSWHMNHAPS